MNIESIDKIHISTFVGFMAATWTDSILASQDMFASLCVTEMLIFNCLSLMKWKKLTNMNDYLVATFLGLFNLLLVFILVMIRVVTGELAHHKDFQKLSGIETEKHHTILTKNVMFW